MPCKAAFPPQRIHAFTWKPPLVWPCLLTQPYSPCSGKMQTSLMRELSFSGDRQLPRSLLVVLKTDIQMRSLPFPLPIPCTCLSVNFSISFHMDCIFAEKRVRYMVYFVFRTGTWLQPCRKSIRGFFSEPCTPCYPRFMHCSRRNGHWHCTCLPVLHLGCDFSAEQLLFSCGDFSFPL